MLKNKYEALHLNFSMGGILNRKLHDCTPHMSKIVLQVVMLFIVTTVEPPVASTSHKPPPLLSNWFFRLPRLSKSDD